MRLLSLFMIVGYFEIYEVLMFYHGEKLWLYSGLTEILMLALLIVINNEGCFWRNYCILILEQGMTSLFFSIFGYASPDLNKLYTGCTGSGMHSGVWSDVTGIYSLSTLLKENVQAGV